MAYPPDWSRPWWRDWQAWVEPTWSNWRANGSGQAPGSPCLPALLNRLRPAAPVRFVPQSALPDEQSYEGFIFAHRQVPTRDNLHDLFNACCWRRFPLTKLRLNALQADVIDRDGVGASRGPLRDALTLFDENALLLQAPPAMWEALRQHDWATLLVEHRQDWCASGMAGSSHTNLVPVQTPVETPVDPTSRVLEKSTKPGHGTLSTHDTASGLRPVVFGHALLEKLCQPYKSVTAHAFWVDPSVPATDAAWDAWLAERLQATFMATKPFQPLPVMGIPGWCEDNVHPAFYADTQVFRPFSRRAQTLG